MKVNKEDIQVAEKTDSLSQDKRAWRFSLVGAGIGAGILFLPIEAGQAGFVISFVALLIAYPIVYFAQKYLLLLVIKAGDVESINGAIENYTGKYFALIFSFIYGVMTFVMVSAYAIGINTTLVVFLRDLGLIQVKLSPVEFSLMALVVLGLLTTLALFGERLLIKILGYTTILLIGLIALTSILFISEWNLAELLNLDLSVRSVVSGLFILIPIFVFAITVIQPLSPLVCFFRRNHDLSEEKLEKTSMSVYRSGFFIFVGLIAMFTFSAILVLEPSTLAFAKANNLSALVVFEGSKGSGGAIMLILECLGMGITFFALLTSYYGIGFGFTETLAGNLKFLKISFKAKKVISTIIFNVLLWLFVSFNFNILNTIGVFVVPCMGLLVFVLPASIVTCNKKFRSYRNLMTYFVLGCGMFLVVSFFIGLSMQ